MGVNVTVWSLAEYVKLPGTTLPLLCIEKPACAVIGSIGVLNCKTIGVALEFPFSGIFASPFMGLGPVRVGPAVSLLKPVVKEYSWADRLFPQVSCTNGESQLR